MNDDAPDVMVDATDGGINARPALARAVALLHAAIVVFFTVGWLLPWSAVHWLVIGGGAMLPICWTLFDNECPLTRIERHLAGAEHDAEAADRNYFVSRVLSRILGRTVSDRTGTAVIYAVLSSSMVISFARLVW